MGLDGGKINIRGSRRVLKLSGEVEDSPFGRSHRIINAGRNARETICRRTIQSSHSLVIMLGYVQDVPVWYAEAGYHRLDGWLGEPWDFLQGLVVCGDLPQESRHALPTHPTAAGELS